MSWRRRASFGEVVGVGAAGIAWVAGERRGRTKQQGGGVDEGYLRRVRLIALALASKRDQCRPGPRKQNVTPTPSRELREAPRNRAIGRRSSVEYSPRPAR